MFTVRQTFARLILLGLISLIYVAKFGSPVPDPGGMAIGWTSAESTSEAAKEQKTE